MIPTHDIVTLLGLSSGVRLRGTYAVRVDTLWYLQVGSAWRTTSAAERAALESYRANWVRCGSGWRVASAPGPAPKRPLTPDALAELVRDAVRLHPDCVRGGRLEPVSVTNGQPPEDATDGPRSR